MNAFIKSGKKILIAGLLVVIMALSVPINTLAVWRQDAQGSWQWTENGVCQTGWKQINGQWYHFDENGRMSTGWIKDGTQWYYLENSGVMAVGWKKINGNWFYLKDWGDMAVGWLKYGGKWYFLNENGVMAKGWKKSDDMWYYLGADGAMDTGWVIVNQKKYFMNDTGIMQTGLVEIAGKVYCLGKDGAVVTGKVKIDGKTYEFSESGESIGIRTPKPEKAFDSTGRQSEITVSGSVGGFGGGGSAPSGDAGGGSVGGGGSGSGGIVPISEGELRAEFDRYLVSNCAAVNKNLGNKASFTFDKEGHTIDVTIKDMDSIIGFVHTGASVIVSNFPLSKFSRCSINGSGYTSIDSIKTITGLFSALGLSLMDDLESLDGKTVQISLQGKLKKTDGKIDNASGYYSTLPYIFRFHTDSVEEKPQKKYYFGDLENKNQVAASCQETEDGLLVTVAAGYEIDQWIRLYGVTTEKFRATSIAIDNAFQQNNTTQTLNATSRWMRYTPFDNFHVSRYRDTERYAQSARRVQMIYDEQNGLQTYAYLDSSGKEIYRIFIQYCADGRSFLLKGLTFKDFAVEPDDNGNCLLGGVWLKETTGSTTKEPEIIYYLKEEKNNAYTLDESGLQLQVIADEYFASNFNVSFSSPISLNGQQITSFQIRGLSEKSEDVTGTLYTGTGSYRLAGYDVDVNGMRTYQFSDGEKNIPIRLQLSEKCTVLTLPDLTPDVLAWQKVTIEAYSYPSALFFTTDDNSSVDCSFTGSKKVLTVQAPAGTHFSGQISIGFDKDMDLNGFVVDGIGDMMPDKRNGIYLQDVFCSTKTYGYINGDSISDISYSTEGDTKTFLLRNQSTLLYLSMQLSKDGKQIIFSDLTKELLADNCATVLCEVISDNEQWVHTEDELQVAVNDLNVDTIKIKPYRGEDILLTQSIVINREINFIDMDCLSADPGVQIIFDGVGQQSGPLVIEGLKVDVKAEQSYLRLSFSYRLPPYIDIALEDSILEVFDKAEYLSAISMDMDSSSEGVSETFFYDVPGEITIKAGKETSSVSVAQGVSDSLSFVQSPAVDGWEWIKQP